MRILALVVAMLLCPSLAFATSIARPPASDLPYSPTTAADWTDWTTEPTNPQQALDSTAAWIDDHAVMVRTLAQFEAAVTSDDAQTLVIPKGVNLGADVQAALIGVADTDATTTDTVLHDADPTQGSISAALVGEPLVIIDSAAGVTRGQHCIVAAVDAVDDTITCDRPLDGNMGGATYRIGAAVTIAPGDLRDQERLTIRCEGGGFVQHQDDSASPPVLVHRDDTNIGHDSEVSYEGCNFTGTCSDSACTDGQEDVFSIVHLHTGIGSGDAGRTYFFDSTISKWTAGATTGNLSTHVHGDRFYLLDGPTNSVGDQVYMSGVFIDATLPFQIESTLNRFQVQADAIVNSNTNTGTAAASPVFYATADMDEVLVVANTIEYFNYFHFADVYARVIGNIRAMGVGRAVPPGGAYFSLNAGSVDLHGAVNPLLPSGPILEPAGVNLFHVRSGGTVPVSIRARLDDPRCVFSQSGTPINLVDADAGGAGIKTVMIDWVDGDDCEPIVAPLSAQAEAELDADAVGQVQINGSDTWEIIAGSLSQGGFSTAVDLEADGSLSAESVSTNEMANSDFGNFSCLSGLCTLDDNVVDLPELVFDPATQVELDAKSAPNGSTTNNGVARFDGTDGDLQNSTMQVDDSGNAVIQGNLTAIGNGLVSGTMTVSGRPVATAQTGTGDPNGTLASATPGLLYIRTDANPGGNNLYVSSCVDSFDTGGPPQTSGSPDGSCDSDGVSNAWIN